MTTAGTTIRSVPLAFVGAPFVAGRSATPVPSPPPGQSDRRTVFVTRGLVSPDGAHVYVAAWGGSGAVVSFARNPVTGALTFLTAYPGGGAIPGIQRPNGITIDPSGDHVYLASWGNLALTVLARTPTTGALAFRL